MDLDQEPSHEGKYCHTFSSNTGVSVQRTWAAAGAHLLKSSSEILSRSAKICKKKRLHMKMLKQNEMLLLIHSTEERKKKGSKYSIPFLKENVVVFDGGCDNETAQTINSEVADWCCHKIKDGHLEAWFPLSEDMGMIYKDENDK